MEIESVLEWYANILYPQIRNLMLFPQKYMNPWRKI